jgi:uncharacterized protein YecT (DUF1311 family)
MRLILIAGVLLLLALPAAAQDGVRLADRAAIEACLQKETDAPERCIGTVDKACENEPGSDTTVGMQECTSRERRVWQEMIEASLKRLNAGPLGATKAQPWNRPRENARRREVPGTEIIADMERTFVIWRAKLCDTMAMQAEGGTLSPVIYGHCTYKETGRHALWLKTLEADVAPH